MYNQCTHVYFITVLLNPAIFSILSLDTDDSDLRNRNANLCLLVMFNSIVLSPLLCIAEVN